MGASPIDFSSIGGKPVPSPPLDFSSIGGRPVEQPSLASRVWKAANEPISTPIPERVRERVSEYASHLPEGLREPAAYAGNLLTAVPASMVEFGRRMMNPLMLMTGGAGAELQALKAAPAVPGAVKAGLSAVEAAGGAAIGAQGASQAITPRQEEETGLQEFERRIGGTGQALLGTVAAGQGVKEGVSAVRPLPNLEKVPALLAKGVGLTSPDAESTLATYQRAMPHLADIERASQAAGQGGAHTGEAIFKATRGAINELGAPIRAAVAKHGDVPAGGRADIDANIRAMAKAEGGTPNALQQTDPQTVRLAEIGQGQGPLTVGEADFLRQYAGVKSTTYHKQIEAGAPGAERSFSDWTNAENYLRNVEYNKLKDLTGLDVDSIQRDRSNLIRVNAAALRKWALDLRKNPTNLAQSIGIPFGLSRIVNGGLSFDLPEVLSGASEVAAFAGWKWLLNRTLPGAMKALGRSELTAPNYQVPLPPGGPPPPAGPAGPTGGTPRTPASLPPTAPPTQGGSPNVQANPSPTSATPAPGPAPYFPGPQANVSPPLREPFQPSGGTASGAGTVVRVPGESAAYGAHYDVRELSELRPSHSGLTFQPTEGYQLQNDRDYMNAANQGKILMGSAKGKFDPSFVTTDNPDATNGPPVIASDGHVLGGNGRTMILQRVYKSNPEGAAAYRAAIEEKAQQFGIDPAKLKGMKNPVLVRVVDDAEFTKNPAQNMLSDLNKSGVAALTPSERAVADSKRVSQGTLDDIGARLSDEGESGTIASVLQKSGRAIVDRLISDGVISPQERAAFVNNGAITEAGKQRVSKLVVGRFFEDPAQLDALAPSLRGKLERIAAPLARATGEWDVTPQVQGAVRILEEAEARGASSIDDLLRQGSLVGQPRYDPAAVTLAKALKDSSAVQVTKMARAYASDAAAARSKQTSLLGQPVPREQAFEEAFGR